MLLKNITTIASTRSAIAKHFLLCATANLYMQRTSQQRHVSCLFAIVLVFVCMMALTPQWLKLVDLMEMIFRLHGLPTAAFFFRTDPPSVKKSYGQKKHSKEE